MPKKRKNYYVYRFKNKSGAIIYVGKTVDLFKRFYNHEHLSEKVKKIEYIICHTKAEMSWKEIYYINLYHNEYSENITSVENDYKDMYDYKFEDIWYEYNILELSYKNINGTITDENILNDQYKKYVIEVPDYDYDKLIHICNHKKINHENEYQDINILSYHWLSNNLDYIDRIKKDIANYYRNIINCKSNEILWTTFHEYKELLLGKGYTKGFVEIDEIMTEYYNTRTYLAYLANNYKPSKGSTKLDNDKYAITKLMQFIWRSALSNEEEITIYIPSKRMRDLLKKWIKNRKEFNNEI